MGFRVAFADASAAALRGLPEDPSSTSRLDPLLRFLEAVIAGKMVLEGEAQAEVSPGLEMRRQQQQGRGPGQFVLLRTSAQRVLSLTLSILRGGGRGEVRSAGPCMVVGFKT